VWSALSRAQAQAREALMRHTQKDARGCLIGFGVDGPFALR
jgi:hypothetical protein